MTIKPLDDIPIKLPELMASRLASAQPLWSHLSRSATPNAALLKGSAAAPEGGQRRRKIWELGSTLHCSIIGTCLSTGELKALLKKFTAVGERASDHEVHHVAVSAVSEPRPFAKQIQKALERHHRIVINQFAKARNADELRRAWDEAMQAGNIPGAYWAALTHPAATQSLVQHVFGAVHMLSHLVGAANRADIVRLHRLEGEKAALEEKLARQQAQLRDAIVTRDNRIRELTAALATEIEGRAATAPPKTTGELTPATFDAVIVDLRRQLDTALRQRERAVRRAEEQAAAHNQIQAAANTTQQELTALRGELEACEARIASFQVEKHSDGDALDLTGITLLYVGGRPRQISHLRWLVEESSGMLLHHDGGVDQRTDLLPGLLSRADLAFLPVDCVSHAAAQMLKRLCHVAGKPFLPLRSSGAASLLHALRSPDLNLPALRRPV